MFKYLILLAAVVIAGVAAFFSVFGLSKLFAGAVIPVIIMASSLEIGKLVTASLLSRHWKDLTFLLKSYYVTATFVLITITSAGIYGFLTAAYQTTSDQFSIINQQLSIFELRKERYQEQLDLYIAERRSISSTIDQLSSGLANNVIQYVDSATGQLVTSTSGATRVALQGQLNNATGERSALALSIEEMTDSITSLDIQSINLTVDSDVAREIGPLRYLSNLTGWEMDRVVNMFALLIVFVFDPLAVSLIVGFNRLQLQQNESPPRSPSRSPKKYKIYEETDEEDILEEPTKFIMTEDSSTEYEEIEQNPIENVTISVEGLDNGLPAVLDLTMEMREDVTDVTEASSEPPQIKVGEHYGLARDGY